MNFASEPLLITLLVGAVAGWLAGLVMRGSGYGIIGDIIVGLLGAFIGNYLFRTMNWSINVGNPYADRIAVALIGAILLMFIVGFFRPRSVSERMSGWLGRR